MEIINYEIPSNCRIFDSGDVHAGPLGFHREAFIKMLSEVESDKNARLLLKGDLVDCITPDDKRFSAHSHEIKKGARNPQDHADELIEMLRPVASKIIALQWGNHEFKIANTFDITKYMCEKLGVNFGGYTAVIIFKVKGKKSHAFKWLATHGRKSINSTAKDDIQAEANMKAALKKHLSAMKFDDCVYQTMGHTHKLIVVEPTATKHVSLRTTTTTIKQDYRSPVSQSATYIPPECRYYVNTGSFLKTFAESGCVSYAELAQYGPVEIGCVEAVVQNGEIVDVKKRLF